MELRFQLPDRLLVSPVEKFDLYHCPNCGCLAQAADTIVDRISQFYPDGYWWDESGPIPSLERSYREWVVRHDHLRFLTSVVPDPDHRRLLDIGCGSAVFLKLARETGFDAFGLEQSSEAVKIAEKEVPGRVIHGTEQDLIAAGESFDILVLFHTLEHVLDPFHYLRRVGQLLRRPGGLIVQVPNVHSVQARVLGSRWYGLDCPRHVCNFTQHSLLHLLGRCGYRVERVRHFSLRDNAAAIVSSLFPGLDPMGQRIRSLQETGRRSRLRLGSGELIYFALLAFAQPLAWAEARLGRGGTLTVYATLS